MGKTSNNKRPRRYTDEEILSEIRRVCEILGGATPTRRVFDRYARIPADTASRYFGTWSHALEEAGLTLGKRQTRFSDNDCLENLLAVWMHYGRQPFARHLDEPPSQVKHFVYVRKWGTWLRALAAFMQWVGSNPEISGGVVRIIKEQYEYSSNRKRPEYRRAPRYTDEELISELRRVGEMVNGEVVRPSFFEASARMTAKTIRDRFGSWQQALRKAGLREGEPPRHWKRYTEEDCYQNLLAVWAYYRRRPSRKEIARPPSRVALWTYRYKWGDWQKAVDAFLDWANSHPGISEEIRKALHEGTRGELPKKLPRSWTKRLERLRVQGLYEPKEEERKA